GGARGQCGAYHAVDCSIARAEAVAMAEQFLSQDEVDALLEGVTGESQKLDQPEQTEGIRAYNLGSQERIVRGRMPTMEIINERFARNLRIGLFNFMRRSP